MAYLNVSVLPKHEDYCLFMGSKCSILYSHCLINDQTDNVLLICSLAYNL